MTLSPTPQTRDISITTQRVQLSLHLDSQQKVADDNVGGKQIKEKAEERLRSKSALVRLSYSALTASFTVSFLVQRHSYLQHLSI